MTVCLDITDLTKREKNAHDKQVSIIDLTDMRMMNTTTKTIQETISKNLR